MLFDVDACDGQTTWDRDTAQETADAPLPDLADLPELPESLMGEVAWRVPKRYIKAVDLRPARSGRQCFCCQNLVPHGIFVPYILVYTTSECILRCHTFILALCPEFLCVVALAFWNYQCSQLDVLPRRQGSVRSSTQLATRHARLRETWQQNALQTRLP